MIDSKIAPTYHVMPRDYHGKSPERYPLTWPAIYPRTPAQKLQKARFEVSFAKARDELLHEVTTPTVKSLARL